jgi:magnesium transporter
MGIAARTFEADGSSHLDDPADISEIIGRGDALVWVDIVDGNDEEFQQIAEEFELHPLAMEDARKHGQRPKLERYPTHAFLVANSKEMAEIDLFIGQNWLITVRERNSEGQYCHIEGMRTRFEQTRKEKTTVGYLVYIVLDELVDGYFDKVDLIEDRVETVEELILSDEIRSRHEVQGDLVALRREIVGFRKVVLPMRDVLHRLIRGQAEAVDGDAGILLQDVEDHVLRVVDQLDAERELISNASEAAQAMLGYHQNLVMKRMTSWGAILLVSTLIAGIYGMNFDTMPELHWRFGYVWALGLMVLTTFIGYRYFKKKGWL